MRILFTNLFYRYRDRVDFVHDCTLKIPLRHYKYFLFGYINVVIKCNN